MGKGGLMKLVADLHLHSKHSRAVSPDMVLPVMSEVAKKKGIDLLATGDFMHPIWMVELKAGLTEWSEGIYASKDNPNGAKFLLSCEISSIYSTGGKGRRIHTVVLAPSIEVAEKINGELTKRGCNLRSDGRPIVGLSVKEIAELVFTVDEKCMIIPAHVWTPWFGLYGSKSGFDSIEEAYGELADKIYAVETGLSSDPAMNWRVEELENRAIVSFSDAHSPAKMGREATVFKYKNSKLKANSAKPRPKALMFRYLDIYEAVAERYLGKNEGKLKLAYTVEFYPEEGKYHWDGHRNCGVVHSPEDTRKRGVQCPVCGKPLTVGVEYRVDQLAKKEWGDLFEDKQKNDKGVVGYFHPTDKQRPPYVKLVPLLEILAEALGVGVTSKKVKEEFERLINYLGDEFQVLMEASEGDLVKYGGKKLSQAVMKVRQGNIRVKPGYDGVFGEVKIWPDNRVEKKNEQIGLF